MTEWLIKGLIPKGAIFRIADLDDPPPEELIARGSDVVIQLGTRGSECLDGKPVLISAHFHSRLGETPPEPFWARCDPETYGWVRVEEGSA